MRRVLGNGDGDDDVSMVVHMRQDARYSTDNGITLTEYASGEFYEVPDHVAAGMIARGWAVPARFDVDAPRSGDSPPAADDDAGPPPKIKLRGGSS